MKNHTDEDSSTCPSCNTAGATLAIDYSDYPICLFPVPSSRADSVMAKRLQLHICRSCGHLFQPIPDPDLLNAIYLDYYQYYPFDFNEAFVTPYRVPFDLIAKMLLGALFRDKHSKQLLEVGCSRSENLLPFAELGFECLGIDPSPLAEESAANTNIRILKGYYEDFKLDDRVDVIVSRFNLEHILFLEKHLKKLSEDLRDEGIVIVQVPNIEYYFRNAQPLFAAHEHIHYFSLRSLTALFSRFGFSLVTFFSEEQPSIIACFKKAQSGNLLQARTPIELLDSYNAAIARKQDQMVELLRGKERIVLYGCGLSLFWLLPILGRIGIRIVEVIDDNESLQGRSIPIYGYLVKRPSVDVLGSASCVVLTLNPMYHHRVLQKIRALDVRANILSIGIDGIEVFAV